MQTSVGVAGGLVDGWARCKPVLLVLLLFCGFVVAVFREIVLLMLLLLLCREIVLFMLLLLLCRETVLFMLLLLFCG